MATNVTLHLSRFQTFSCNVHCVVFFAVASSLWSLSPLCWITTQTPLPSNPLPSCSPKRSDPCSWTSILVEGEVHSTAVQFMHMKIELID